MVPRSFALKQFSFRAFFIGDRMKLVGERIIVRELNYKDRFAYYDYGKSPVVGPNAGWKPFPSLDIASKVLTGNILKGETFAICLKETNLLIGSISIYTNTIRPYQKARSLGFSLGEEYWNHGYMTEACMLVIEYCFKHLGVEVLEVGHHVGNMASKRVIEKCGFQFEGRLRSFKKLYNNQIIDADFYSMTKIDYERKYKI